jgi:hypothetical protein
MASVTMLSRPGPGPDCRSGASTSEAMIGRYGSPQWQLDLGHHQSLDYIGALTISKHSATPSACPDVPEHTKPLCLALGPVREVLLSLLLQCSFSGPNFNPLRKTTIEDMCPRHIPFLHVVGHPRQMLDLRALSSPWPTFQPWVHLVFPKPGAPWSPSGAFSREVWFKTLHHCSWQGLTPSAHENFSSWRLHSQKRGR